MTRCKELYRNRSAFGGWVYRVIGTDNVVRLERRKNDGAWEKRAVFGRQLWDTFYDVEGLADPYNDNPATLLKLEGGWERVDRLVQYERSLDNKSERSPEEVRHIEYLRALIRVSVQEEA